ncbi:hypothetical protein KSS87_002086 [Heliosperma pusillum]|nr:hypothetical protein KSS87_002086 [Heliosperma pusillum]
MANVSQKRHKIDYSKTKVEKSSTNISNNNNNITNEDVEVCINTKGSKRTRRSLPRDSSSQRSSVYRGVTRHRWTGRFEAHLWDKDCWSGTQKKKGRQGAYDDEAAAARAYDLAALKYWGKDTILNFPVSNYGKELKEMEPISREEYIGSLRRKSSGFSRGVSKYRGVARHHHNGRWEARIGRVNGNKYLYLGTYATQEEAATAYDIAAIEHRGSNAVTNFDLSRYINLIKPNNNNNNNNNSCDDEASPNQDEPTKSSETSASSTITSSSTPISLGEQPFDQIYDEIEENDVSIDVGMLLGYPTSVDNCSSTFLGLDECSLMLELECSPIHHVPYPYSQTTNSISLDFESDEDGLFSELSSFLCDFDLENEQLPVGDWKG